MILRPTALLLRRAARRAAVTRRPLAVLTPTRQSTPLGAAAALRRPTQGSPGAAAPFSTRPALPTPGARAPCSTRATARAFSTQPAAAAEAAAPTPTKKKRRALPAALSITPAAAVRINDLCTSKPEVLGVLLGVKRRGCNGMSYTLNYAEEVPPKDHERIEADGAIVWVEPPALFHIVGTVMDFEESALETGFTFTNPNEKGRCGCGESFNV